MYKKLFLVLGLLLFQTSFAAVTKDGNYYEVKNCGHKAYTDYTITVKQNSSIRKSGSVGPDGCVFYRLKNTEVKPGQNLIIELKNGKVLSETIPSDSTYVPEPGPNNPNPINPQPPVTPHPPMPSPSLPEADLGKVRNVAENQARMIANRVVDKYGPAENARYNMIVGVHEGVRYYLVNSNIYGDTYYKSAYAYGSQKAQAEGYEVGGAEAMRQAQVLAKQDVYVKFRSVVDTGQNPDLALKIPQTQFTGAAPSVKAPLNIQERIRQKDEEFYNYLRDFEFIERRPFYEMYGWGSGYQFELIRSWYRQDWAWQAWLNRKLGGSYENEIDYYNKISDSNKYSNSSEAKSAFVNRFKQVYNNVIDDKWDRAVQSHNATYRGFGFQIGQSIGREYSHDLGQYDGFVNGFTAASVNGFNKNFIEAYQSNYSDAVRAHQTLPQVAEFKASLQDKLAGQNYYLPLQTFDVVLNQVVNAGAKGEVNVVVSGEGVSQYQTKVAPLESLVTTKEPIKLDNVGALGALPSPYKPTVVYVTINGKSQTVSIQVYFDSVMTVLGQTGQRRFVDYALHWLKAEYDNYGKGTFYSDAGSLLRRLVNVYVTLQPQHKINISSYREEIRQVLGKEPGFFSGSAKKQAWRDAQNLVNQLQ